MKVRFYFKADKNMKGDVRIDGFYNGPLAYRQEEELISINIWKHPKNNYIKPRMHGFFEEIYLVLAHEFRHHYQAVTRKYRRDLRDNPKIGHFNKSIQSDVNYLIEYDEVDAYAFECAEQMKLKMWPIKNLHLTSIYRTMYSRNVKKYAPKHFKRFVRKVVNNLNNTRAMVESPSAQ